VYLGRDAHGRKQYANKTFAGSKTAARQEITRLLRDSDTNSLVRQSRETLRDYLKRWLDMKLDVRGRTRVDYAQRLKLYILPSLGDAKLEDLTPIADKRALRETVQQRTVAPRSPLRTRDSSSCTRTGC
jgi:hypothetical protein